MITINNLSHTYNTKSKNKVLALSNISCCFNDTGMYFVVGKSGSGKSTLLNLLGGLDSVLSGDIIVDGVSMKGFNGKDYDAYRANYVGIIFQEFNLLEELTVYQNIELQLNIAGINATSEKINESLDKVGLNNYGKRYTYELSGGERQRVAIARQLAKGVKLLLADEPTGNLDAENGENIFNILKVLSKELTVVVVSHDMDFANRFADSVITIKDGKIDNITEVVNSNISEKKLSYKSIKPHFPFKYISKLAAKSLFKKKIRFSIAAFLSIISFALFGVLGSILTFDAERSLSDIFVAYSEDSYFLSQAYYSTDNPSPNELLNFYGDKKIEQGYVNEFNEKYPIQSFNIFKGDRNSVIGLVSSAEDIKTVLGFELVEGYLPLDVESAYITDYYAKLLIARNRKYLEDGIQNTFEIDSNLSDFIGKKVVISGDSSGSEVSCFKIAGIIDTDYEQYVAEYTELSTDNIQTGNNTEFSVAQQKKEDIYNVCYFNYDGMRKRMADNAIVPSQNKFTLETDDGFQFSGLNINKHTTIWSTTYSNYIVLTNDTEYSASNKKEFNDNELLLPLSYYNAIFNEDDLYSKYYDEFFVGFGNVYQRKENIFPEHIGEIITINVKDDNGVVIDKREYSFGGLIISENPYSENMPIIYISDNNYADYALSINANLTRIAMAAEFNNNELLDFLRMSINHKVVINSPYTQAMYMKKIEINKMNVFYISVGSAFLLISLLMFASYIASTISDKTKDIGIIRAIGGTRNSIFNIFYMLGLVFFCVVAVLSTIAYFIATPILNNSFATDILINSQLLYINPLAICAIFVMSLIAMSLSSLIPILRASKKSPMQCIRQV